MKQIKKSRSVYHICKICGEKFMARTLFRKHIYKEHFNKCVKDLPLRVLKNSIYECKFCSEVIDKKHMVIRHIMEYHANKFERIKNIKFDTH